MKVGVNYVSSFISFKNWTARIISEEQSRYRRAVMERVRRAWYYIELKR